MFQDFLQHEVLRVQGHINFIFNVIPKKLTKPWLTQMTSLPTMPYGVVLESDKLVF